MSATDELRELLDERGVKHNDPAEWLTYWHDTDGHVWSASEMSTGLLSVSTAGVGSLTPEQAIAATLGTAPHLPHFWTHDGTLHIEATRMPTRIVVCEGGTCEFVPKRELDASEAENAKLRELVRDLYEMAYPEYPSAFEAEFADRMRELGVEVN